MRRSAPVLLAAAAGTLILLALGLWQLQRLQWKNALVAQIEARRGAPVTSLPSAADWSALKPDEYEYRHVAVNGQFDRNKTAAVYRGGSANAPGAGPGYLLFAPLRLPDDSVVLVNRGFAPLSETSAASKTTPQGTLVVTGLMRAPEARNAFTPVDRPEEGMWFTRDPASMAAGLGLQRAAPFTLDLDPAGSQPGWPRPGTTVLDIPNNHLSYALTWFGLALALVGVTAAYMRQSRTA